MLNLRHTLVAGVVALAMSGGAQAIVITFDDAASNAVLFHPFATFSDGGLTFTNNFVPNAFAYIWSPSQPNTNGTNTLIFYGASSAKDYLAITQTGGGLFDLNSIDLTISFYDGNPSETVNVNGSPITINQGMQTFTLGLSGVSEVDITTVSSNTGYWALDNINANVAAVPEPEIYAMMAAGLGLMGFVGRRRQRKLAAA